MTNKKNNLKNTLRDVTEAIAILEYSAEKTAELYMDKFLMAMQNDETMHPKTRQMIRQHMHNAPAGMKVDFIKQVISDFEQVDPTGTCDIASIEKENDKIVFVPVTTARLEDGESLDGISAYKYADEPVAMKQNGLIDIILKVECPYANDMEDTFVIQDFSQCKIVGQVGSLTACVGKRYVPFLVKHYANSGKNFSFFVSEEMREYLQDFDKLKNKKLLGGYSADIMSYKNIDDVIAVIQEQRHLLAKREEDESTKRGKASYEYENNEVRIIIPEDQKAACYYGRGTIWCTSGLVHNEFKKYDEVGTLFILIPKNPQYENEKYQVFFGGGNIDPEFKNESEKEVDALWLLSERFGNLISEYFKAQPEYKFWIENY